MYTSSGSRAGSHTVNQQKTTGLRWYRMYHMTHLSTIQHGSDSWNTLLTHWLTVITVLIFDIYFKLSQYTDDLNKTDFPTNVNQHRIKNTYFSIGNNSTLPRLESKNTITKDSVRAKLLHREGAEFVSVSCDVHILPSINKQTKCGASRLKCLNIKLLSTFHLWLIS